jgi:hypothetical protein
MSDMEIKRTYLKSLYGGTRRWRKQVDKMPDKQVVAIYLKEKQKPKGLPKPPHVNEDDIPF